MYYFLKVIVSAAQRKALNNFAIASTLLSPVRSSKKSSYRENLSYEQPWFQRNLARATFFYFFLVILLINCELYNIVVQSIKIVVILQSY